MVDDEEFDIYAAIPPGQHRDLEETLKGPPVSSVARIK
jgi:hypothetical protein